MRFYPTESFDGAEEDTPSPAPEMPEEMTAG